MEADRGSHQGQHMPQSAAPGSGQGAHAAANGCRTSSSTCFGDWSTQQQPQQEQQGAGFSWSHHTPVLLHILAHEVESMVRGAEGGSNGEHSNNDCGSSIGGGSSESMPPWQCTLQCLMAVVLCAARQCAAREGGKQKDGVQSAEAGSSREATQAPESRGGEKQDRGASAEAQGTPGSGNAATSLLLPDQQLLAKHVLEAGLEVLKCLAQREDRGLGLCGGVDPVIHLCQAHHLVLHLLGMLHTLQPVQNPGRNSAAAAAAAKQQHQHQQQLEQRPQGATEAQAEVPRYLQPVYTRQAPVVPPYLGYRGDLLAVLANAICNRPAVAEEVALEAGAVELVLGQCQLDDLSPLAREWGLWAVRNLCAGSMTAQERIKQLEPVEPVESPELRALGMRLEMDHKTGKLKVVRNNEMPQFS
uniref:Ataxin-10 domain-containing protein n=1 Tax=Dunaliella tertiolecta TaxID=3047 RepID=A0A7S3VJ23_DUNTE